MRRKDREITDFNKMIEFVKEEEVFRIALTDEDGTFIVPLNYGLEVSGDRFALYFHGAKSGRKAAALEKMPEGTVIPFEIDGRHEAVVSDGCDASYKYASVMGNATVSLLEGEDKVKGLTAIMNSVMPAHAYNFNEEVLKHTMLCKLTVTDWSCKMH